MPILVLLGAGASFGSVVSKGPRPPLGEYLFDELARLGGVASTVPEHIALTFRRNFEDGMAQYCEEVPEGIQAFQRELAKYLAGFEPADDNLYVELLKALAKRNVIFASLNYDLMLEQSAEKLGLICKYDGEREFGFVRILKPHGSSNFWHDERHAVVRDLIIIAPRNGAAFSAPVLPLSRRDSLQRCEVDALAPAMSLYAKGKAVKTCPGFVKSQQGLFEAACRKASEIYIIGVRVIAEDEHIWKPLSLSGAAINYFGSDKDRVELMAWVEQARPANVKFIEGFFDRSLQYMKDVCS